MFCSLLFRQLPKRIISVSAKQAQLHFSPVVAFSLRTKRRFRKHVFLEDPTGFENNCFENLTIEYWTVMKRQKCVFRCDLETPFCSTSQKDLESRTRTHFNWLNNILVIIFIYNYWIRIRIVYSTLKNTNEFF